MKDLEIPLGKRTPKYRFFEILPGLMSYMMIIMLFIVSFLNPMLGAWYLLIVITVTLVKAIGVTYRTIHGYNTLKLSEKVDWGERFRDLSNPHERFEELRGKNKRSFEFQAHVENLKILSTMKDKSAAMNEQISFPDPQKIFHAVIMVAYNEGLEVLVPSIEAVRDTTFDNEKIIFVFAYEERGGEEMHERALELREKFKNTFYDFIIVQHPVNLKDEIQGKGPNLTYAGEKLLEYVNKKRIPIDNVIVTSLDSDNRMGKQYLDLVAYQFVMQPNRQRLSYQPISLFMNNIWDAPAPMRIIAVSNSFFNVISSMRPHLLRNFASHSQPLLALSEMGFWSKRTIVEDGHQYWRSLFHFNGNYEVIPIYAPIYQDAVVSETLVKTLKAQYVQLRRWDYGASDVAYVGVRLFSHKREMPFWPLFVKFWRLLEGHVTLAAMSPILAFGGWVPRLMSSESRQLITYNLPGTVSNIQLFASMGLIVMIFLSIKMLPPRPKKYNKHKTVMMVLQWLLMPVVAIIYQSFCAFYSQTRLMVGKYMEKFDVTEKVVKK